MAVRERPRPISISSRIGPWRLPLDGPGISPSTSPSLVPNAETWLDFTDLVFIDPPGTGYSRVVGGDQVRERFYSVQGDIDGLAAFIDALAEGEEPASLAEILRRTKATAVSAGRFWPRSCRAIRVSDCAGWF